MLVLRRQHNSTLMARRLRCKRRNSTDQRISFPISAIAKNPDLQEFSYDIAMIAILANMIARILTWIVNQQNDQHCYQRTYPSSSTQKVGAGSNGTSNLRGSLPHNLCVMTRCGILRVVLDFFVDPQLHCFSWSKRSGSGGKILAKGSSRVLKLTAVSPRLSISFEGSVPAQGIRSLDCADRVVKIEIFRLRSGDRGDWRCNRGRSGGRRR